jgi:hypothetical protein
MKDAVDSADWDSDISKQPLIYPITNGVWIYCPDTTKPSDEAGFWVKQLKKCALEHYTSTWGNGGGLAIGKEDVVLVINDPEYFH